MSSPAGVGLTGRNQDGHEDDGGGYHHSHRVGIGRGQDSEGAGERDEPQKLGGACAHGIASHFASGTDDTD